MKFRVLTSLLTSRVSCSSPWVRQNFPTQLKKEQILSQRLEKIIMQDGWNDVHNTPVIATSLHTAVWRLEHVG